MTSVPVGSPPQTVLKWRAGIVVFGGVSFSFLSPTPSTVPCREQESNMYTYADQEKGRGGKLKPNSSTRQLFQNSRAIRASIFLKRRED